MKKIQKIIHNTKKVIKPDYIARCNYLKYYENYDLNDKQILLDSQQGKNLNGNIYYILEELMINPLYKDYDIYVSVNKKSYEKFYNILKQKNFNNCHLVMMNTNSYYKVIASSKYIISDTTLLPFFIKKEGQVYLNVWHGTPLKCLGKGDNTNFHAIGNVQKNFLIADYLMYPNEYMMEHMIEDFMLENICKAKVLLNGYPRNTVFFDINKQKEIRKNLRLDNKEIIVYMPTWRSNPLESEIITNYLKDIDDKLKENQILYVNLHPFVSDSINYDNFKKIKKFPIEYETYEFLSISDILITDYSSVFFDFVVTKRKIILFTYDEEEYLNNRGCYISLDELPFKRVKTIDKLISLINEKYDINYDEFINTYNKYDSINTTKNIIEKVILNKDTLHFLEIKNNHKKNILIYGGSLAKNGITTALLNLMNNIDLDKYNYYLSYNQNFPMVNRNKYIIKEFPSKIKYIPTTKGMNGTIYDKIINQKFLTGKKITNKMMNRINKVYDYELKRNYSDIKFDAVIQYGGYDGRQILLFTRFKCKKIIFAHSDMEADFKNRYKHLLKICKYAYNLYDNIAVVSEFLVNKLSKFVDDKNKIKVVNNVIDYKNIIKKGNEEISLDDNTECNVDYNKLINILNDKEKIKFINVGRFSKEKGHERLIKAFNSVWKQNKNIYLVIIGGHGDLYGDTLKLVNSIPSKDNIIIIKSLSNPFPIVKKCDCFILSSLYEGFGLCLVEADILGLTSFAVDIDGPKKFIKRFNGTIVKNSEKGIKNGMELYLNGKINKMKADYETYNENAINQFYNLLK